MSIGTGSGFVYLGRLSLVVLMLFFALPFSGMAIGSVFAQPAYQAPMPEDFSKLAWSEAFDKLHGKLSREYAFTDWKGVDWPALYSKFKPRIKRAQASKDFAAYYLALREYVHSIPDGHVRMTSIGSIDNKFIGGGFGFSATKLSDGKVIASWVDETSAAYAQGLRAGAELIEWNGLPVETALHHVSTIFGTNSATAEELANQQVRYLTRAPIHAQASLVFDNNGERANITVVAYDDKGKSLTQIYPATIVSDGLRQLIVGADNPQKPPESMIEKKILGGNIGYIKLWGEFDADLQNTGKVPSTLGLFRAALDEFNAANVKGLIIDIRNNVGGLDSMVADMLASFYPEKTLYEYQNSFNSATGAREILAGDERQTKEPDLGLYIEPGTPFFRGLVVALINSKCVSSGEGLAMGIKNAPRGETVGFYGTHGSFGLAGGEAKLPGNLEVHWPYGQSLDKNRQVQIDSRGGVGGISPSIRTPMTRENALKVARGEDAELEHAIEVINTY
ncbi:S41 family peptidase [Anaeroselena agilis]|uniref:S41 family peptidase n=1 Tax=Anaeroselena agilis TaxID=3063788 RepID=A0ABU3NT55_9FIRM|nr:S41 family peptidase [Selenomonadales bacterium 4137-cl]